MSADPAKATVPLPVRQPPTPTQFSAPTPPTRAPRSRSLRGDRKPGGTALDRIEDLYDETSAGSGWRGRIYRATGIDFGSTKDSTYELSLRDNARKVLGSVFPIAVLNLKGGVGKTVVVEALGSTFAEARDDRVIAVDLDVGDLSDRHGRRIPQNLADLLAEGAATQYMDIRAHTFMNSFGLEVLGMPDYARTNWRLEPRHVSQALSILRNHYSVVLLDCVKELKSGVVDAVLRESRALVVVTSTSIDAVRMTKTTLEWLCGNGYRRLLNSTLLAINNVEPTKPDAVAIKELQQLSERVAAAVTVPFDRHVHQGTEIGLERLSRESRRSYLEMASALSDMFPSRDTGPGVHIGARRSPRRS